MHSEAAFLAGYALALVAFAAGVESLGRRSTHPWSSRTLAACRPPDLDDDDEADWPHSEAPVFHTGISSVILAAALALTIVSTARHHDPSELVAQGALLVLISTRILRLITRRRTLVRNQQPPSAGDTLAPPRGGGARSGNAH